MIPLFYQENERSFASHGIGPAADATSCTVKEALNGEYELEMELPALSRHFSEIGARTLILAKPNPYDQPQPFRIYREARRIKMTATEYARHISYDLDGIPLPVFTATSAAQAIQRLNTYNLVPSPFSFSTDVERTATMAPTVPTVTRALLGGQEQSLLEIYGGELYYDRFNVQLLQRRGEDRGVVIAYGKNLTDFQQERNIAEVYTGVMPYWTGGDGTLVQGAIQNAPGTWSFQRIKCVDLSSEFDEQPTVAQLNAAAREYIQREGVGVPVVSLKIGVVPPGSLGLHALEDIRLGDTVTVRFEKLGIDVKSTVVAYTYDALRERYVSIEIGERQETAASALTDAGRLKKGKLEGDRLKANSIGGGGGGGKSPIKQKTISVDLLGDKAVTVNKIGDGAITSVKVKDGAITGNKILDQAISYAKLDRDMQVTWVDILAANRIFAGVINADGSVTCASIIVNGVQCMPRTLRYTNGTGTVSTMRVLAAADDY